MSYLNAWEAGTHIQIGLYTGFQFCGVIQRNTEEEMYDQNRIEYPHC